MFLCTRRFCSLITGVETGQKVLDLSLAEANRLFAGRICAAYALGSLGGGGGFSRFVSDVDFAIILDKLNKEEDNKKAQLLTKNISQLKKQQGIQLADRLSFFYMSSQNEIGRFPPVDRRDLFESGRLLQSDDNCRLSLQKNFSSPTNEEIILSSAQMANDKFNSKEADRDYFDPLPLLQTGQRQLTKRILFPVRFILTAQTNRIGRNHDAVSHYLSSSYTFSPGASVAFPLAAQTLVKHTFFDWRFSSSFSSEASDVKVLVREGLLPLYISFVDVFLLWLRNHQHVNLDAKQCVLFMKSGLRDLYLSKRTKPL